MQTYIVKITRNDSVTAVVYTGIWYTWWQCGGTILAMEKGEKGVDREYLYYPVSSVDHVHVIEEGE